MSSTVYDCQASGVAPAPDSVTTVGPLVAVLATVTLPENEPGVSCAAAGCWVSHRKALTTASRSLVFNPLLIVQLLVIGRNRFPELLPEQFPESSPNFPLRLNRGITRYRVRSVPQECA